MSVLVLVEHDRGTLAPASLEALTAARSVVASPGAAVDALVLGEASDEVVASPDATVDALVLGDVSDEVVAALGDHGAGRIHHATGPLFADYGPEAWGAALAQAVEAIRPQVVLAAGTDRGNEVLAQAASTTCGRIASTAWASAAPHASGP